MRGHGLLTFDTAIDRVISSNNSGFLVLNVNIYGSKICQALSLDIHAVKVNKQLQIIRVAVCSNDACGILWSVSAFTHLHSWNFHHIITKTIYLYH